MNEATWYYQSFESLTVKEIYEILKIRNEVFIVEQNCPYQDVDDKDQHSFHLCAWINGAVVAYVRIIPPGISYAEASIGRVLTSMSQRRTGMGKLLMKKAIEHTLAEFDTTAIRIGAQLYLLKFYSDLGFRQTSEQYLEDGIAHVEMLYKK